MRKHQQRLTALAAAAAFSVPHARLGLAAKPVASGHDHFTTDPHSATFCGVAGTAFETVVEHFKVDASGSEMGGTRFTQVFTATATGKSIKLSRAETEKVTAIENGDGTITYLAMSSGLALQFKILNGSVLKLPDGSVLRSAGTVTISETIDAATGGAPSSRSWPSTAPICSWKEEPTSAVPVIAYLTAP